MITTGSTAGLDRVEAAYIREAMKRSFFRHVPGRPRYQSTSTSTPTLPWGAPNPNSAGRSSPPTTRATPMKATRTSERLTAYLELDFARKTERLKRLGRHNLTATSTATSSTKELHRRKHRRPR